MNQDQLEIPIQPVEQPILCNPYKEPDAHWVYDTDTGEATKRQGRREAGYWYKTQLQVQNNFRCVLFRRSSGMTCRW